MDNLQIGNTPLVELAAVGIDNCLFAKLEYLNPSGSHYDRVYFHLLTELERQGKIAAGVTTLVETSSGNAGISCAFMARQLGYKCLLFVPAGIPKTRKRLMEQYGAEVRETPAETYIEGSAKAMRQFLLEHNDRGADGVKYYFSPNHSQLEATCTALEPIAHEVLAQVGDTINCFVGAAGNGSTLKGIGRVLKKSNPNLHTIAFDPDVSPVAHALKYGNNKQPPTYQTHNMFGAGAWGVRFPHLEDVVTSLIDEVLLVTEVEWKNAQQSLAILGYNVGPTSAAAYLLAQRYCKLHTDQRVLIIFYDQSDRY